MDLFLFSQAVEGFERKLVALGLIENVCVSSTCVWVRMWSRFIKKAYSVLLISKIIGMDVIWNLIEPWAVWVHVKFPLTLQISPISLFCLLVLIRISSNLSDLMICVWFLYFLIHMTDQFLHFKREHYRVSLNDM